MQILIGLGDLADQLPDSATWKDVAYDAYVRQEVEAGLAEAREGDFASDEAVTNTFMQWGVQIETERAQSRSYK